MADNRANKNADSLTNAQGEFQPSVAPSEPLTTKGHQPGLKTSPADHAPEFSAQTLPAGTAPTSKTYQPNPQGNDAIPGQADNATATLRTDAQDTLPGATSADVHTGLGHPGSGQTSQELHRGGSKVKGGAGMEGLGVGPKGVDGEMRKLGEERGFGEHGGRTEREHNVSLTGAEGMEPVRDEELAGKEKFRG